MNDKKREQDRPKPDRDEKPRRRDHTAKEDIFREGGNTIRDTYKPPPPKKDGEKSD